MYIYIYICVYILYLCAVCAIIFCNGSGGLGWMRMMRRMLVAMIQISTRLVLIKMLIRQSETAIQSNQEKKMCCRIALTLSGVVLPRSVNSM